jgi:hypothetical protein
MEKGPCLKPVKHCVMIFKCFYYATLVPTLFDSMIRVSANE